MPTRINGNLMVLENVSPFRVNLMWLFGGFLNLSEDKPPHKKFWLKASIVAHLQHITTEELEAQRKARLDAEQQAAEISLKRQRDMDAKRAAEAAAAKGGKKDPALVIPSRDNYKGDHVGDTKPIEWEEVSPDDKRNGVYRQEGGKTFRQKTNVEK